MSVQSILKHGLLVPPTNDVSSRKVREILDSYKRDPDKTIQRSELLKRSRRFLEELHGFSQRVGETFFRVKGIDRSVLGQEKTTNILLKLDYPVVDYSHPLGSKEPDPDRYFKDSTNLDRALEAHPKNLRQLITNKTYVLNSYVRRWEEFCDRWHADPKWNGRLNSLERYLRPSVEFYQDWDHDIQKHTIYIRINEWTTLEDIKTRWGLIEEIQDELWGKKEVRTNFGRDIVWYDLAKAHKLRPSEIARAWVERYPDDVKLLVVRRFKGQIDRKDLAGRVLDDRALLDGILSGSLSNQYKLSFEEELDFYTTGRIKKGAKHSKWVRLTRLRGSG